MSLTSIRTHVKIGKKRFEIACYKNKILEWRSGTEKDLDNVLQIPEVFLNVSKGQTAPKADLEKAFGKLSRDDVVLEILNKGEIQVGDKERHAELERMHAEVIDIVAGKLVDPKTKRVYTPGMIEKALDILSKQGGDAAKADSKPASGAATPGSANTKPGEPAGMPETKTKTHAWTGVVTSKSAKSQALEAMKALIEHQPIAVQRARMRLRVTCPASTLKQAVKSAPKASSDDGEAKPVGTVKDKIIGSFETVESQDVMGDEWEVMGFADPGVLKILGDFLTTETKGRGRVEVLDMAVMHEGE
jgi:ribosome maturation protein SDO1